MLYLLDGKVRAALFIVGMLGAIFAPPWVPLLAMAIMAVRYPAWEIFAIGLFVDLLWFVPSTGGGSAFGGSPDGLTQPFFFSLPLFTLAALIVAWGLEPLRNEFLP